jgi:PKHD-type hydroxylase
MNLENYYWHFKEAIPPRICDDIVEYGNEQQEDVALTSGYSRNPDDLSPNQKKELEKKRKSNIVWMNELWIYRELQPLLEKANKNAGWNFQWDWSETCQFTKYKLNQYYDWHTDSGEKPYDKPDNPNTHGKIRKLSMTVSLVDGSEYEGGDFQLDFRNKEENDPYTLKHARSKGSVVIFPSFVWHRVTPVTSGQRYSLVCWTLGWPYK